MKRKMEMFGETRLKSSEPDIYLRMRYGNLIERLTECLSTYVARESDPIARVEYRDIE